MEKLFKETEFEREFDSTAEGAVRLPWIERQSERFIHWSGRKLKQFMHWFFVRKIWHGLGQLRKFLLTLIGGFFLKMSEKFGAAFGKVIGYFTAILLIVALSMSFTANGYSLSRTFSWKGLVTLYKTWE